MSYFLVVIFDPLNCEGNEGYTSVCSNLESAASVLESEVQRLNSGENALDFEWSGSTYYPSDSNARYGSFAWGRIYEAADGEVIRFSEYS